MAFSKYPSPLGSNKRAENNRQDYLLPPRPSPSSYYSLLLSLPNPTPSAAPQDRHVGPAHRVARRGPGARPGPPRTVRPHARFEHAHARTHAQTAHASTRTRLKPRARARMHASRARTHTQRSTHAQRAADTWAGRPGTSPCLRVQEGPRARVRARAPRAHTRKASRPGSSRRVAKTRRARALRPPVGIPRARRAAGRRDANVNGVDSAGAPGPAPPPPRARDCVRAYACACEYRVRVPVRSSPCEGERLVEEKSTGEGGQGVVFQ
jgi:hypothetical protein